MGFNKWPSVMGLLFVFLIIAVVIPCTISDIIVPSYFARFKRRSSMRSVRLENVTKLFNGEVILENINLTIPAGKIFVLLGPSGCGKTTLLRLIGGFETVDKGLILLGDEDITDLPINQRHINTVFQSYALFPHMTVVDNICIWIAC